MLDMVLPFEKTSIMDYVAYTFGVAATKPDTLDLISDSSLSTVDLVFSNTEQ